MINSRVSINMMLAAVLTLVAGWAVGVAVPVAAETALRPMTIHKLPELGLEVWTEQTPAWLTETVQSSQQTIFTAQTPVLTYPPAAITVTAFPKMRVQPEELREVASTALQAAAKNYGADTTAVQALQLVAATHGALTGFETTFTGRANGDAVDVKVFVGHSPGSAPVLLQAYTLEGKLPHISENIRRAWNNVSYLD